VSATSGARRAGTTAACLLTVVLLVPGCGAADPVESVPELEERLAAVDAAIVREDYAAARTALRRLVETTTEAEENGELEDDQADAILAAATRLEARLPAGSAPDTTQSPEPTATTPPAEESEPDLAPDLGHGEGGEGDEGEGNEGEGHGEDDNEDDEDDKEEEKEQEEAEKEAEKEEKEQEKEEGD